MTAPRLRQPIMALFALLLFARVLVPQGWMPLFEDGRLLIQPCPTAAPIPAPKPMAMAGMDHATMDHGAMDHGDHPDSTSNDCPFGIASTQSGDAQPILPSLIPVIASDSGIQPLTEAPRLRPVRHRAASARGPPIVA